MQSESLTRRRRRRYSQEFKANAIAECLHHGVSIASVALAHGLNANLLRRWVVESEAQPMRLTQPLENNEADAVDKTISAFVPLTLPATSRASAIQIELRRGETSMSVTWPLSAAAECAQWMREWLR